MNKALIFGGMAALALALAGCGEGVNLAPEPSLSLVSVSPTELVEYSEKVVITLRYTDGDGDLGENDAAVKNLFVRDQRNEVVYAFRIPQLAPTGATIAIQGELPVELTNLAVLDEANSVEQTELTVWVIDRAGNRSNEVTTETIQITRQ